MRGGIILGLFSLYISQVFATHNTIIPSLSKAKIFEKQQKKTRLSVPPKSTRKLPLNINNYPDTNHNEQLLQQKEKSYLETIGRKLEKGKFGVSLLFSGKNTTNSDVDLVFAGIDKLVQKSFRVNSNVGYFLKDNFSVGAAFSFITSNYELQANILQNFLSRDIKSLSKTYTVNPFIKNYIPLSSKNIVYITNQTELQYSYLKGIYRTLVNKDAGASIPIPGSPPPQQVLQEKNTTTYYIGLGIRPGLLIFFNQHIAFETNISILSWGYKMEKLEYNYPKGEPAPKQKQANTINNSMGLDFKLDILNVGFGLSYYL